MASADTTIRFAYFIWDVYFCAWVWDNFYEMGASLWRVSSKSNRAGAWVSLGFGSRYSHIYTSICRLGAWVWDADLWIAPHWRRISSSMLSVRPLDGWEIPSISGINPVWDACLAIFQDLYNHYDCHWWYFCRIDLQHSCNIYIS